MSDSDTIAAIATAAGRSGIGIVRISGPGVGQLMLGLFGRAPAPRRATLAEFRDAGGEAIDQGIALFFPGPASYTGEDVLELQGHGGPVVLRELLKRCFELGARPARPGEFTERAYLNEKLDLAQAECVADLIDAATAQAARSAVRSLQGAFSQRLDELLRGLIDLRARVEAVLDFPEDEIDPPTLASADSDLTALRERLGAVLAASRQGSLLRDGAYVVLAGPPNVGKSSLLNRLAGEELAIVTEIPGTTRDAIRQSVSLEGIPLHVIDTAGLRRSEDPVERIGIERTWAAIEKADVLLLLQDATHKEAADDPAILERLSPGLPRIRVINKIDLIGRAPGRELIEGNATVWISAKTGSGLDELRRTLLETLGWHPGGEGLFMARERHVQALLQANSHLERAAGLGSRLELFAEELRLAQRAIGSICGEYTPDDLLGEIFSRFCIGK